MIKHQHVILKYHYIMKINHIVMAVEACHIYLTIKLRRWGCLELASCLALPKGMSVTVQVVGTSWFQFNSIWRQRDDFLSHLIKISTKDITLWVMQLYANCPHTPMPYTTCIFELFNIICFSDFWYDIVFFTFLFRVFGLFHNATHR